MMLLNCFRQTYTREMDPQRRDDLEHARPSRQMLGDQSFGMILLSPAFALVLCLAVWPIVRVVTQSFFRQDLDTGLRAHFAGIDNYVRLANDGRYWQAVRVTLTFTFLAVSVELLLGLGLALALNEPFRGRAAARAAVLIPWALPTAVLALAWAFVFNDQYGVVNDL